MTCHKCCTWPTRNTSLVLMKCKELAATPSKKAESRLLVLSESVLLMFEQQSTGSEAFQYAKLLFWSTLNSLQTLRRRPQSTFINLHWMLEKSEVSHFYDRVAVGTDAGYREC